ncbi:FmdB family regulatory protein [Cupriavidus sp. GA3-3]|uniref:FmdB family zinc ribbon protein n=1 Tax=Cupriavidus sp. GA3-3 TaxID=1229514 RepID=UPI00032D95C1|nr:zinc ribbon domain-containing protein [Cupriavidus sp. GA3-3]EON18808.1 FmdB family regulatory protein [Cupriavidus sp. GA3-3]
MPIYEYACAECGSFSAVRRIDERDAPQCCPGCGQEARRLVTATMLALMPSARRVAHAGNERSAHAPVSSQGHRHGPGCGCSAGSAALAGKGAAKSFPGTRPWMISH